MSGAAMFFKEIITFAPETFTTNYKIHLEFSFITVELILGYHQLQMLFVYTGNLLRDRIDDVKTFAS